MKQISNKWSVRVLLIITVTASGLPRAVHAAPEVVEWGAYWWDTVPSRLRTVPSSLSNVVAIAAGGLYNLALTTEGRLVAWGNYYDGTAYVPITVPSGLSNVVAIAAGYFHSVALLQQPTVPMPKLELSRGTSGLLLHTRGTPGISCQLLRASQLPGPWLPTEPVTFTNRMQWLRPPDASPSAQFFRLLRK